MTFCGAKGSPRVSYVQTPAGVEASRAAASGEADFTMAFAGPFIVSVDAGHPIVMLAGVHVGCFELFGNDQVRTIRDLKGKTVAVQSLQSSQHVFLSSMAAYVGFAPRQDITWATYPFGGVDPSLGRGEDRRLPGVSARAPGAAREEDWTRRGEQRSGPSLVAILLLPPRRDPRVCREVPGGHQACGSRDPES
jgi:NMT1/THI5 like